MKIGYVKNDYPEKRCIIEQVFGEGEYAQVLIKKEDNAVKRFCLRAINHFKYKLGIKNKPEWNKTAVMKKHRIKNVDILHVFNTVCDVKIPWCTTFESETPVTSALVGREWEIDPIHKSYNIDRFSRRMLTLCARDNCRALIAL